MNKPSSTPQNVNDGQSFWSNHYVLIVIISLVLIGFAAFLLYYFLIIAKRKGPIDFDHIDRTIALLEQTRGQKDFTPENLENKTNDAQITDSESVTRIDATNNGKVLETGEVAPPMTFRWHANGSTPSNTTTTQKLSISEISKESFANASPSSVGLPTKNDKANGIITDSILPPVPYSKKSNIKP